MKQHGKHLQFYFPDLIFIFVQCNEIKIWNAIQSNETRNPFYPSKNWIDFRFHSFFSEFFLQLHEKCNAGRAIFIPHFKLKPNPLWIWFHVIDNIDPSTFNIPILIRTLSCWQVLGVRIRAIGRQLSVQLQRKLYGNYLAPEYVWISRAHQVQIKKEQNFTWWMYE